MSDLIDDPAPGENAHDYSVSEISGAVKRVIEGEFGRVRVRGEVGRVTLARSGHLYFDLKDDRSVLASVSWKGQVARLSIRPEEGMEVVATGRLTTFGSQSRYQLNVDDVQVAGEGALMAMLKKRMDKLRSEGLFDDTLKRPLPYLPGVIGVVTSPTGAVIRDILHRLRDRFPRRVLVWPVAVQGDASAAQVARAIEGFNALTPGGALPRPDVLIVARGGGSIEDLWGFNEEIVARAAAASDIPLISAVGHETDTTLIDYVSDRRAPTPTAAAEMAVPVRADLLAWLAGQEARIAAHAARGMEVRGQRLRDLSRGLPRVEALTEGPRQRLDLADGRLNAALSSNTAAARARYERAAAGVRPTTLRSGLDTRQDALDRLSARLAPAMARLLRDQARGVQDGRRALGDLWARMAPAAERVFAAKSDRLAAIDRLRQTLGYRETLRRGYAVVRSEGALLTDAGAARAARQIEVEFHDGRVDAVPADAPPTPRAKPRKPPEPGQGSLF